MSKLRPASYLQIAALVSVVAFILYLVRFPGVLGLVTTTQQRVMEWGAWSVIFYPLLFALCNLLLLPGGILCVGSGFFFGLWWGFLVVFVGNGISAAVSFAISRWLGQHWLRPKLSRHRLLRALEPAVEREGWKIIVLSQLHPLFPTSLINYFYGLTRIPFRTYMLWVLVGRAPGIFLYVYLGTLGQLGLNLARGKSHPRIIEYWTWGGAFVVSAILLFVLSQIARRAVRNSEADDQSKRQGARQTGWFQSYNINI
jgi:uncharacterized membrane protein YdjX (TVP38/TMEM64 family)